jgi:hypothetical protein
MLAVRSLRALQFSEIQVVDVAESEYALLDALVVALLGDLGVSIASGVMVFQDILDPLVLVP